MKTQAFRRRVGRGFTLIEILVVIAILSLLAAILFPVFSRARESARRTSCASNLKQLGMAFMQYTQDSDERLPLATDGGNGGSKVPGGWVYFDTWPYSGTQHFDVTRGNVYPYVKNPQVYICPSDTYGSDSGDSYAYNACMTASTLSQPHNGKNLAVFPDTSIWMLLSEESMGCCDSTDDGFEYPGNTFSSRHLGGSNIAFLDGHVKFFRQDKIVTEAYQYGGGTTCPG
ncbi:MAG: DUF1559 domain-containing protein [Abitibacteriaceae bacterium]|nr:DUF1559 domain-containing protein [Abditibacteriaceae bacterium]